MTPVSTVTTRENVLLGSSSRMSCLNGDIALWFAGLAESLMNPSAPTKLSICSPTIKTVSVE